MISTNTFNAGLTPAHPAVIPANEATSRTHASRLQRLTTTCRASLSAIYLIAASALFTCASLTNNANAAQNLPANALLAVVDLPVCEVSAPGMAQGLSLGIVQPYASDYVVQYAARLTLQQPTLSVCSEAWPSVLPRWLPWAQALERGQGFASLLLAFVLAVAVLWRLTPRHWWRRTTLLGVLGVLGLTWVLGTAGLAAFHALGGQRALYGTVVSLRTPQQAQPTWHDVAGARELEALLAAGNYLPAAAVAPMPQAAPGSAPASSATQTITPNLAATSTAALTPTVTPKGPYKVYHRVNVREQPGVQSPWLTTLARGAVVQFDGELQGDWWRIKTASGQVGWASSLWLRRPEEIPGS